MYNWLSNALVYIYCMYFRIYVIINPISIGTSIYVLFDITFAHDAHIFAVNTPLSIYLNVGMVRVSVLVVWIRYAHRITYISIYGTISHILGPFMPSRRAIELTLAIGILSDYFDHKSQPQGQILKMSAKPLSSTSAII